jgi:hypothetical protein
MLDLLLHMEELSIGTHIKHVTSMMFLQEKARAHQDMNLN